MSNRQKYDWWHIARPLSWRRSVTSPKLLLRKFGLRWWSVTLLCLCHHNTIYQLCEFSNLVHRINKEPSMHMHLAFLTPHLTLFFPKITSNSIKLLSFNIPWWKNSPQCSFFDNIQSRCDLIRWPFNLKI